jgi:hypothetical protein
MPGAYAEISIKNVDVYGSAAIESGQFVKYKYGSWGHELNNQWLQDNLVILGIKTQLHPRLQGVVGVMGWINYSAFPDSLLSDPSRDLRNANIAFSFDRAEMVVNLSPDIKDSLLKLEIGLFPYKYNKDARNLGEYMFRSGCYPGFLYSAGFDMSGAQLSGLRVSNSLVNGQWHNDLLLTSELYLYPLNDFSLTLVSDFTTKNKVFTVGAGLQLYRCLPVNADYTQPQRYINNKTTSTTPLAPNYYFNSDDPLHKDTLFYTFAGTKIMARFTFDPKPLFSSSMFGAEDLKLYGEAIILGVKDYPANPELPGTILPSNPWNAVPVNEFGYDKLMQKMPIMLGINLPTFKILDVLSVETEYYGKKYVNRVPVMTSAFGGTPRLPVPYDNQVNGGYPEGDKSYSGGDGTYSKSTYFGGAAQWKWSIYAKKTLLNNLNIAIQAARDHSIVQTSLSKQLDYEEALIKDNQWYWMLKLGYDF